jgi:general stress protein 26
VKPDPHLTADELRALALDVMRADPFPMLATAGAGQARVRPVSPVKTDGFTVYVASMRSSGKTEEIAEDPRVELCYLSKEHDQVRITGVAEAVGAGAERQEIWDSNPLLRAYLKSIENPEFMLYRVAPNRVRYMREWALAYHEVPFETQFD